MDREQRRRPSRVGGMAIDAGCRDVQRDVVRIGGVVVIGLVTAHAGVGCVVVISIWVAAVAINSCMCSGQRKIVAMNWERCRCPSGVRGMTINAGCRNAKSDVIGICGVAVIGLVTTHAGIGCAVIVALRVTAEAISCSMGPRQGIISIMDRENCRCPSRVGGMAIIT